VHVRVAHRDYALTETRSEEWLLIEWPKGEKELTKYFFQGTSGFIGLSITPSYAGASSVIIWTSNRRWDSVTSKGEDGVASIITQRCPSPSMDS
jgi:hypothetical protein